MSCRQCNFDICKLCHSNSNSSASTSSEDLSDSDSEPSEGGSEGSEETSEGEVEKDLDEKKEASESSESKLESEEISGALAEATASLLQPEHQPGQLGGVEPISSAAKNGAPITVGSKVILSNIYKECQDAADGPLKPGDVGTIVEDDASDKPYRVSAENGDEWWYVKRALTLAKSTKTLDSSREKQSQHKLKSVSGSVPCNGCGMRGPSPQTGTRFCESCNLCSTCCAAASAACPGCPVHLSDGRYYCGRMGLYKCSQCDGQCGPGNGCQCPDCFEMSKCAGR